MHTWATHLGVLETLQWAACGGSVSSAWKGGESYLSGAAVQHAHHPAAKLAPCLLLARHPHSLDPILQFLPVVPHPKQVSSCGQAATSQPYLTLRQSFQLFENFPIWCLPDDCVMPCFNRR